jgi:hypothetical protein
VFKLAKKLNIQPRELDGGTLYTAIDVEGHRGDDGRYYLLGIIRQAILINTTLDLSRMFPPTKPDKRIISGHLFQLFRPEVTSRCLGRVALMISS